LVERESLWCRVLSAWYGVEGGRVLEGGRDASYCGALLLLFVGRCGLVSMLVVAWEMGRQPCVWFDVWVGGVAFMERFSRLFDLSLVKEVSVFEMSQLGWGRRMSVEVEARVVCAGGGISGGTSFITSKCDFAG